jgi:hypothetical protein
VCAASPASTLAERGAQQGIDQRGRALGQHLLQQGAAAALRAHRSEGDRLAAGAVRRVAGRQRLGQRERIRYRWSCAGCRHHANDNIADFIATGELEQLQAEVQARCRRCCARW